MSNQVQKRWSSVGFAKLSSDLHWLIVFLKDEDRIVSVNVYDILEIIAGHLDFAEVTELNVQPVPTEDPRAEVSEEASVVA